MNRANCASVSRFTAASMLRRLWPRSVATRAAARRLGIAAFAFFMLKGLLWLVVPVAYLLW